MDGLTIARQRIAREAAGKTGFLDLGRLALTELPDELFQLKHLRRLNLGWLYIDEDGDWQVSASDLGQNSVAAGIDRLTDLAELRHLVLSDTDLSDLAPLRGLSSLQLLDCRGCRQVGDLAPLRGLTNLKSIECNTCRQVSDLAPLQDLTNLLSLGCSHTQVSDLVPLQGLTNLRTLDCSGAQVSDLAPLQGLTNLQTLYCSGAQVSDLAPLRGLTNLQTLRCSHTRVSDLAPLQGLSKLRSLDCSGTPVSDLAPLQDLSSLRSLDCSGCRLTSVPEGFWFKPSLTQLVLYQTHLPGIPAEVLSQEPGQNCLDSLRTHLGDLDTGM